MSKITPKRFAILCHKLAILSDLQLDLIQEINPDSEGFLELKKSLEDLNSKLEPIVESVFGVKDVMEGNYFYTLSKKVDTLFRKEYQLFPERQKT